MLDGRVYILWNRWDGKGGLGLVSSDGGAGSSVGDFERRYISHGEGSDIIRWGFAFVRYSRYAGRCCTGGRLSNRVTEGRSS